MKTVLLVEDNTDIRDNMSEILELANYKVLLAADGRQGVTLAIKHKPDIILCDIMMPELDGYGVIHLLQKNDTTKNIPFIFLTAKAERVEVRKGMELGADDYITKPFSSAELLSAIEGRLKKMHSITSAGGPGGNGAGNAESRSLESVFAEDGDSRIYKKKERIYSEGQRAYRLYYVVSGSVKLFKTNEDGKDLITTIAQPGDFLGYTALMQNVPYQQTAEALEDAEITSISQDAFDKLLTENPEVIRRFVSTLAGSVHEKEEQLLGLAYNSLRKKVAEALLSLHKKYVQQSNAVNITISRENLAAMAGTAKESLIRTLGDFRDEGLIEIKGGDIHILQEKKMASLLN